MKRIALVGTAPSRKHAPFHDLSVEIWGVGMRAPEVTRADRWFELHRLSGEETEWQTEWRKAIKGWPQDFDLYMFYPEPDLAKKVVQIDTGPICAKYGTFFMTSSFSWMMAMAIEEVLATGEKGEILLFGVDMEYGTEYREQRTGLRHFLEVAKLFGISVTKVVSSGLAYEPIPYPLWQDDPLLCKLNLRSDHINDSLVSAKDNQKIVQTMLDQSKGRISVLSEVLSQKDESPDLMALLKNAESAFEQYQRSYDQTAMTVAKLEGIKEEQDWFKDYLQP